MAGERGTARTVEVDGIPVTVTIDPSDDYELATCSMVIHDPESSDIDRSRAVVRRNVLVLGDGYQDVLDALRESNGGVLRVAAVNEFVAKVIKAVPAAKN